MKMKKASSIFRDRPKKPLDEAIFWIEYILRHDGAPHLRSAGLDLSWFSYFLLDILAAVVAAIFVPLYIIKKLLCGCFGGSSGGGGGNKDGRRNEKGAAKKKRN